MALLVSSIWNTLWSSDTVAILGCWNTDCRNVIVAIVVLRSLDTLRSSSAEIVLKAWGTSRATLAVIVFGSLFAFWSTNTVAVLFCWNALMYNVLVTLVIFISWDTFWESSAVIVTS